jgi:hypothetical protein
MATGCGGANRVQELAGVVGYDERERTEGRENVWEVAGDGVRSKESSEGVFIGRSGLERGCPEGRGPAAYNVNARRGGLGSVLAR